MPTRDVKATQLSPTSSPPPSKRRIWPVALVLSLVSLLAAYAVGRAQGADRLARAEQRADAAEREHDVTGQSLREAQRRIRGLEARRALHLSLLALDKRNFGIAQEQIVRASQLLLDEGGEWQGVGSELDGLKLQASDDLETQRKRLLELVANLDVALSRSPTGTPGLSK